ncbi:AraC family transcriptional regulator [Paenibacillus monticola]|uniref:Helix-turn-helix domain-containing protein n=1 Tax=Paenibacillus monticola TaxID=2666075 RepID=A0A7X2H1X8_9BACL|nr:AraC family transcriptional regulator [Paenibacillus monticola]MRN52079.1 helix-turn-helix domain-containing protein [Paenibacillus monticola]
MYEHRYRELKLHGQPEFPLHIYRVEHQTNVHSILPVHWHNEMEIIYLAKGRATFNIESREFTIQAGDALIVHPGELHSGIDTVCGGTCYYSIVFKLSWLSSPHPDRVQELFLDPVLQGTARLPGLLSAANEPYSKLLDCVRELLSRYERQSTAYEMSLKALLQLFIADIYHYGLMEINSAPGTRHGREYNRQIKQVLAYMEEHFRDKLELDQLASVVSLSRSHFCKFFKTQTGMRPMEYLNYIRISQAANLLRSGSYNILEAALESGYQHVSYFSKWFKYYMHMTPSDYRARYSSGL